MTVVLRCRPARLPRAVRCSSSTTLFKHTQCMQQHRRCLANVIIGTPHPTQQDANAARLTSFFIHGSLLQMMSSQAIGIGCRSSDIHILHTPTEFYNTLLQLTQAATQRITLSSLYLGTGKLEQQLIDAISKQCSKHNTLRVHTLFDYLRGTRQTSAGTTVDVLRSLLSTHSDTRVRCSYFHVPVVNSRLWHRLLAGRNREAIGVHHMKFYIFDNSIVISGANLSDTYFTNRQDRYIVIHSKELADFYDNVAQTISHSTHTYIADTHSALRRNRAPSAADEQMQLVQQLEQLFIPKNTDLKPGMNAFHSSYSPHVDCWLFPTLQLGSLNIRQDERVTESLINFSNLQRMTGDVQTSQVESVRNETAWSDRGKLDITTGYLNLTPHYTALLQQCAARIRLIGASYTANGWYGAHSIYKYIPDLYAAVAYNLIEQFAANSAVQYYEYVRDAWSYHAKGVWYTASGQTVPNVTLIGSTNFGLRSVNSDSESNLVIVSQCDSPFCHQLQHERQNILQHCNRVTVEQFERNALHGRAVSWYMQLIGRIAKYYM